MHCGAVRYDTVYVDGWSRIKSIIALNRVIWTGVAILHFFPLELELEFDSDSSGTSSLQVVVVVVVVIDPGWGNGTSSEVVSTLKEY